MKNKNLPTIETKNLRIEELYKMNDDEFNKQQQEGVAKRVGN
jgi:coenzyme F420 hydrogenase subunit beta